jgi:hypothetical protein
VGIELFFVFYFSGGGDFPVRGKVPSNNKALQADADKVFGWIVFRGFISLLWKKHNSCAA